MHFILLHFKQPL